MIASLLPLVIYASSTSPTLVVDSVLPLPVAIETAVWMTPTDDELRLWINRSNPRETVQLRILSGSDIEELPPVPIVASGSTYCNQEFILTGSNQHGEPVVLGVDKGGDVLWEFVVDDSTPIKWPVPGCLDQQPVIVWQTSQGSLKTAHVGVNGISQHQTIPIGGPPFALSAEGSAIRGVWSDASGIHGVQINDAGIQFFDVSDTYSSEIAIGEFLEEVSIAWIQEGEIALVQMNSRLETIQPLKRFQSNQHRGGTLEIISGTRLLLWMQTGMFVENEEPNWSSSLVLADGESVNITGLVHKVAWWKDRVVVAGTGEIQFLRSVGRNPSQGFPQNLRACLLSLIWPGLWLHT